MLNYFAVSGSFFCIYVIAIYAMETPQFFKSLSQPPSRVRVDPSWSEDLEA